MELSVDIFSFNMASLESRLEIIEERAPVEMDTETTPMIISKIHSNISCML